MPKYTNVPKKAYAIVVFDNGEWGVPAVGIPGVGAAPLMCLYDENWAIMKGAFLKNEKLKKMSTRFLEFDLTSSVNPFEEVH